MFAIAALPTRAATAAAATATAARRAATAATLAAGPAAAAAVTVEHKPNLCVPGALIQDSNARRLKQRREDSALRLTQLLSCGVELNLVSVRHRFTSSTPTVRAAHRTALNGGGYAVGLGRDYSDHRAGSIRYDDISQVGHT
jgi:hypothetical protein